ncbi:MAG: sugar ABC transporter ATP-binding protein [Vallitaleaceae bacterium]|nr:sugar ABC transporter ATP-binding protein [Vallitaleaceae bacterium]
MPTDILLRLQSVSKTFPGVKALEDIDFELNEGEVHCLCGENGAGKSTLIKILSGAHLPDQGGEIYFEGEKVKLTPHYAMELGIQTIYQEHIVFPHLSIVENIFSGMEIHKHGLVQKKEMIKKTSEVLTYLDSNLDPESLVGDLSSGEQKLVEIAKGLIFQRKVIILDEPTASFSASEIEHLLGLIRTIKSKGIGVIYISHHLDEVFKIADRITVIRDGQKVNTYNCEDINEQILIKAMVGRDASTFYKRETVAIGDVIYEAKNITGNGAKNVSLQLHQGEILGISGMVGSGRSELMNVLFGAVKVDSGQIFINGKEVNLKNPADAIRKKMCFITEDRQHTGLFLAHSIARNTIVANLVNSKKTIMLPKQDVAIGEKFMKILKTKAKDANVKVVNLSGGNQQKVVLAKWFNTEGEIYIFDEPTRGIDVGAKQEIYQVMVNLLKQNKGIIMVSSDMPEIIAMSDRIVVMKEGEIQAVLQKEEITEENILTESIGGAKI